MKVKEFNILLSELSDIVKPLNQILYEILILISFYFLFTNIKTNQTITNSINNSTTNTASIKNNKSFIILIAILAVAIDWFIWNNPIQTIFFLSILAIYIYYNLQNITIISTFINLSKDIYNASPIIPEPENNIKPTPEIDTIPEIFRKGHSPLCKSPLGFHISNPIPQPFDTNSTETKEIHEVYKSDKPYVSITDTKYAEIMLNDLYTTPQYKNIQTDEIDATLDNNIHSNDINQIQKLPTNQELLDSFKNPKKIFLDNKWLTSPRTYNDNCVGCSHPNANTNTNTNTNTSNKPIKGKNAICTVVPFGRQLSECTNQDNTITKQQLDSISDNKVIPLQI
jgi:hypothetical protein